MRRKTTPGEDASIEALLAAFRDDRHIVQRIARPTEDRPDALLEIDGMRIACECVQVPPDYIYAGEHAVHSLSKWDGRDILSFLWPNEPHQWIADAIRKKNKRWQEYLSATGAQLCWLLVHAPLQPDQNFLDGTKQWIQSALRHGTKMVEHRFEQVFLWTPQSGIKNISIARNETLTHSELGIAFSQGYPTLCVNRIFVPFRTASNRSSEPIRTRFVAKSLNQIVTKPHDKEYARHPAATRQVEYNCEVIAWSTRATLTTTATFAAPNDTIILGPRHMRNLTPNTAYTHHALHEFQAPKLMNTWHAIQLY